MKKILITGGTGFVGANLARHLLKLGHELHLLVRNSSSLWRLDTVRNELRLHQADLTDVESVSSVIASVRPEWIFHLAAYGAYSWQNNLQQIVRVNIAGTVNLVESCLRAGFEAFVNTGSSSEYGFKDHAPSEEEALEPNSHYSWTKGAATHFCRFVARQHQVLMPTLRLYSIYGPFEDPGRLFPTLITNGLKGQWPPLVNPEVSRDFVYVEDVCDAYVRAATYASDDPGVIYNLGTGVQTTLREVTQVAQKLMGLEDEPIWESMPNRSWDTTVWVSNPERIRRSLHWTPRYSLERGMSCMIDWLRTTPAVHSHYRIVPI